MYSYDKCLEIPLYRYFFPDLLRVEALLGTHRHLYCQYQFWEPIYAIAECPREYIYMAMASVPMTISPLSCGYMAKTKVSF